MINSVKPTKFLASVLGAVLLSASTACAVAQEAVIVEAETATEPVSSIAAVSLNVLDLDASVTFYTSVLGLSVDRAYDTDEYRESILKMPSGNGSKLVLMQYLL